MSGRLLLEVEHTTKALNGIITAFIILIVGIAFLVSIAGSNQRMTQPLSVSNQSFTGINATAVNVTPGNNFVGVSAVRNATQTTLTVTTHYTINTSTGSITVLTGNGTYYADYTYLHEDYINNSTTRSLSVVIVLMLAIALLVAVIGTENIQEIIRNFR